MCMNPADIQKIFEEALKQSSPFEWWHFVLFFVLPLAGGYIGSYFRQKGKNLATKEDIETITKEIESVKFEFAKELESIKEHNQLKLAALDERLNRHQTAYTLWRGLLSKAHKKDEIWDYAIKCQKWWNENCLYLAQESRESFLHAIFCAQNHSDFLQDISSNIDLIMKNWTDILKAGEDLTNAIDLPAIAEEKQSFLDEKKQKEIKITHSDIVDMK